MTIIQVRAGRWLGEPQEVLERDEYERRYHDTLRLGSVIKWVAVMPNGQVFGLIDAEYAALTQAFGAQASGDGRDVARALALLAAHRAHMADDPGASSTDCPVCVQAEALDARTCDRCLHDTHNGPCAVTSLNAPVTPISTATPAGRG